MLIQDSEHFATIAARNIQVEQDQIRTRVQIGIRKCIGMEEKIERLLAVAHDKEPRIDITSLQDKLGQLQVSEVILDDQDIQRGCAQRAPTQ